MGKGNHEVTSSWTAPHGDVRQTVIGITRSNISIIGQGIGETTIVGGIAIHNVQNITLKQLPSQTLHQERGSRSVEPQQDQCRKFPWPSTSNPACFLITELAELILIIASIVNVSNSS